MTNKKSINMFQCAFNKLLAEDNLAGGGGVFGDYGEGHGGAVGMTDFYATKDGRSVTDSGKRKKKKQTTKNKQKDIGTNMLMPVQRRPLSRDL
jgi:hypothetical protein